MKELASSLKKTLTLFITFIAADDDWYTVSKLNINAKLT